MKEIRDTGVFQGIPEALRALPQWVVRRGKMPIDPKTGSGAKAGDPSTWASFDHALGIYQLGGYDGIGFEFADAGGLVGIDLDHCIDPKTGEVSPEALRIVAALDSYTELSPSGTGIHIIAFGSIPKGRKNPKRQVEMYSAGRYFTMTGKVFEGRETLHYREKEVAALYAEMFPREDVRAERTARPAPAQSLLAVGLERDRKFKEYWDGRRDSGDESSNDIAFMNKLAYWCNCDIDQMIAAFDASPYAAQKDDKHQKKLERADYLKRTAERAVRDCKRTAAQDNEAYAERKARGAGRAVESVSRFINPIVTDQSRSRYTLDDIGASRLFADTFKGILRYVPEFREWFVYSGGVWQLDSEGLKAAELAKQLADYVWSIVPPAPPKAAPGEEPVEDEFKDARSHYRKYRALKWRNTMIRDSFAEMPVSIKDFDQNPLLFNCKNGTLDLSSLKLHPHEPTDFLSKQAEVNYRAGVHCERFERFIEEITEGDRERARMLQKVLGYSLKGEANEECYFNAVGEKTRNGKGTLFDTILNLFGSYGAQMDFNTIARANSRDGSRATPDLARLVGVRFVLANEPDKGIFVNEALLKQITGNDDLTARALYAAPIQFKPVFKLFITANSRPNVTDDSLFSSDRVKILPFPHHFAAEERDTALKSKLRTEDAKSGILNWLLDGYALYCAEGLRDTKEMQRLVAEYRRENDYIGQYIDEQLVFNDGGPGNRTPVKAIRMDYARWCEVMAVKPLGYKAFKNELVLRGIYVYDYANKAHIDAKSRRLDDFFEYSHPP